MKLTVPVWGVWLPQEADTGAYRNRLEECLAQIAAYEAELRRSHAECEKHTEVNCCCCRTSQGKTTSWLNGSVTQETRNEVDALKRRLANSEAEK
jgi:hypothetical protein